MSALDEPKDPTAFNSPNRLELKDTDVSNLGQALMSLTKELWVLRDRMHIMEAVLEEHGLSVTDEINNFQPNADMQAKLNADGKALVSEILDALAAQ